MSECCGAEVKVLETGTYDPDEEGFSVPWAEVECQQCGSVYFARGHDWRV